MSEPDWLPLDIDPEHATFPVSVTLGGKPVLIFRTATGFRGIQERCPHDDRSFVNARIIGDGKMVRCTYHNYTFKLESGRGVNCPGYSIAVYDVIERDGALFAASGLRTGP